MKILRINRLLKIVQKILFPWKNLSKKTRKKLLFGSIAVILILTPVVIYTLTHLQKSEAAWFDANWGFRQNVAITNAGSAQTDYQIAITLDTATLITAGKMRSDCNDIRITDMNGKILPYWIETGATGAGGKACNASTTQIWTKVPSVPTSGQTIYLYYGNPGATSVQNGDKVFEFFDDFSSNSLDTKWTGDTSNFSISGGYLSPTNSNYRIQSSKVFSGNYEVISRVNTTTGPTNGYQVSGFFASNTNNYGVLAHGNGTNWYTRNDSTWHGPVSFTWTQWVRADAKVIGTAGSASLTGETSGTSNLTDTNSGISNESIALGRRYDNTNYNQTISATWDWIFVKKATATEPTVGSPTSEEVGAAPVAYWKFNEGTGTIAHDSSSNQLNGTITGATWKSGSDCMGNGKCLYFSGMSSGNKVDLGTSTKLNPSNFTISAWVKYQGASSYPYGYIFSSSRDCCGTYNGINLMISGGRLYGAIWNSTSATVSDSNSTFPTNQWVFVTFTYDGSVMKLYRNGLLVGTANSTLGVGSPASFNNSIGTMGNGQGTYDFQGYIGEVKLYSYMRSYSQIQIDYNSLSSLTSSANVFGASTANQNLSNGLVGYWKMDESTGAGSTLADSSGNGKSATANLWGGGNTATDSAHVIGKYGNSFSFDGGDDYLDITQPMQFSQNSYTASFWLNTASATTDQTVLSEGAWGAGGRGWGIDFRSSNAWWGATSGYISFNSQFIGGGSIGYVQCNYSGKTNAWVHIVAVKDFAKQSMSLYMNGILCETRTFSNMQSTETNDFQTTLKIGKNSWTSNGYFNGKVDETRIYNRALSPAEVSQLYNYAPPPVAYWNFEEGQGDSVNDISGNSNTGTWGGTGNHWTQGKYGKAGNFNGTNDYVRSTHAILPNASAATISFWMNIPIQSSNWRRMLSDSTTNGINLWFDSNGTDGIYGTIGNLSTQGWIMLNPNLTGGWHYITITASADDGKVNSYLDGKFVSNNRTGFTTINLQDLYMGSNVGASYFLKGSMDEVKIYNYVRTQGQIVQDMNASHPLGGSPVGSQVGYWKFDEGYGLTNYNSGNGGHTYDGTITSATFNNDGKFGKAISFDGTTGKYVTIPAISSLSTGNPFTISVWVKPGSTGTYRTIVGYDGTHRLLIASTGQMLSQQSGNFFSNAAGDVPDNKWTYVAYTFDGTQEKWYINGKQSGASHALTTAAWSSAFKVGQYDNVNYPYKGLIDELKIYSSALTASEIQLDYNHGASMVLGTVSDTSGLTGGQVASNSASSAYCVPGDTSTCNSPVGEWNFEEGYGNTVNDTSGNGMGGIFNGSPVWSQGRDGSGLTVSNASYLSIADSTNSSLDLTNIYTINIWVYPKVYGSTYNYVLNKSNQTYGFYLNGTGKIVPVQNNTSGTASTNTVPLNKWSYISITYDGTNLNTYINGVLDHSQNVGSVTLTTDNNALKIGSPTDGNASLIVDEIRIYNYTRTPAQVAWDYNRGGPVGYWKFDECQGTTLNDSSGNGNAGTINIGASGTQTSAGTCATASTAWGNGATGKYNASLNFDGSDDNASATDPNSLRGGGLTISTWYKTSSTVNYNTIFNRGSQGNANGFVWLFFDNSTKDRLWYQQGNASYCSIKSNAGTWSADGQWHNLAVTQTTAGTVTFYKDGNVIGTGSCAWKDITNNTESIGTYNGSTSSSYTLTGQLDDLRLYDYPLTTNQIQQTYNQGAGVRFGPLTGNP